MAERKSTGTYIVDCRRGGHCYDRPHQEGKSSLTRVINGLIPLLFVRGNWARGFCGRKTAERNSVLERGKIAGNVFQDPRSQFFANEVAGEIAFGCENYGYSMRIFRTMFTGQRQTSKFRTFWIAVCFSLSYGMRQKVAIASAEAIDPEIYVMG